MAGPNLDLEKIALNVTARRVLLDAFDALESQRNALVLVGAQAVYLRTQHASLSVAAYTRDGDLSLNPDQIADAPLIEESMRTAGFRLAESVSGSEQPGSWIRTEHVGDRLEDMEIDLMLPAALGSGRRRRSVDLPPHNENVARQTVGLEAATIDCDPMEIRSLEPEVDSRMITVNVARVAALLVAKAYKISDRIKGSDRRDDRLSDKDAGDVVRLMRAGNASAVAKNIEGLIAHVIIGESTRGGLLLLQEQFGAPRAPGVEMAVRALAGGVLLEDEIRALCPAYVTRISG